MFSQDRMTTAERKQHDTAIRQNKAEVAAAQNALDNHENLGSPYTAKSVMQGVAHGMADMTAGAVIGEAVQGAKAALKIGGATSESTTLFRAVSQAELTDIGANGLRTTSGGYETSKLFTTTSENAAEFGKLNFSFDGISNTIIEAKVPNTVMNTATEFTADGMPAIAIPAEQLQNVKQVFPLLSSPIKF